MSDKPTAVRVYLARVRTSLADLPPNEVEEILEDVRPHLAELEAEVGPGARVDALIERLGTPESYAAELRAAGGYPAASDTAVTTVTKSASSGRVQQRIALWGLVLCTIWAGLVAFAAGMRLDPDVLLALSWASPLFVLSLVLLVRVGVARVMALPETRWLSAALDRAREQGNTAKAMQFLVSLKPAWWIVCAVTLVGLGFLLMARHRQAVLLLPFLLAVGVAAVWAGQRVRGDRRLLWMVAPVSAFVVGGLFGGFGATVDVVGNQNQYPTAASYYPTSDLYGNKQLSYGGAPVDNIYAFDAEGKPLTDIYLYNEEGQPISLSRYSCHAPIGEKTRVGDDNRFPRPQVEVTAKPGYGPPYQSECRETAGVPFSAAIPKTTTSAPPPSASTAPSPSGVPSSPSAPPSSVSSPVSPTPTK